MIEGFGLVSGCCWLRGKWLGRSEGGCKSLMTSNDDWHRLAEAWDTFLRTSRPDIGFMQSTWWAELMADHGWGHFGAVFRDNGEIIGGARVLRRSFGTDQCYYYIPEGPVLPADEAEAAELFEATLTYIDKKRRDDPARVSHLRLEPRWSERPPFVRDCREAGSWQEPRQTLHIDLALSEAELLAQMKPKGRYNIRVAQKNGVAVVEDKSERGADDFLDIYGETMDRHDLRGKRTDYLLDLMDELLPDDRGSLFFAEHQGARLATALIVYFGDRATYFFGGSRTLRRQTMAPYLLHFEAIRKAKTLGHRWYDFYGVAPPDQPNHKWAKISDFKRKFGGVDLGFVPALDFIYDDASYQSYRRSKSRN